MNSKYLTLIKKDYVKALITTILAAAIKFVHQLLADKDMFSITIADLKQLLNVAIVAGLGYLLKNYLTTEDGKFLGKF